MDLVETVIPTVRRDPQLPNDPLIINIAPNTFRVLFSVPMRIPPRLKFTGLPENVAADVIQNSEFGFTVLFTPPSVRVEKFGYEADAEL